MIEFTGIELIDMQVAIQYRLETLNELAKDSQVWDRDIEHLKSALNKINEYLK